MRSARFAEDNKHVFLFGLEWLVV